MTGQIAPFRMLFGIDPFLLGFRTGRWRLPWALLATATAIALIFALGFVGMAVVNLIDPDAGETGSGAALFRMGHVGDYLLVIAIWLALAFGGLLSLRLVKGDPMRLAFTQTGHFHASDFAKTAAALAIVYGLSIAVSYAVDPAAFTIPERRPDFPVWLALGITVILVQSASEEVLFRGALFRIWGAIIPARIVIAGITALFIGLHLENDDVQTDVGVAVIVFALSEIVAYWMLLRTKCLAAPMGLHWMNNVSALFLVASMPGGDPELSVAIYTDPILTAGGSRLLDPWGWIMTLLAFGLLLALLLWRGSPLQLPQREAIAAAPMAEPAPAATA